MKTKSWSEVFKDCLYNGSEQKFDCSKRTVSVACLSSHIATPLSKTQIAEVRTMISALVESGDI